MVRTRISVTEVFAEMCNISLEGVNRRGDLTNSLFDGIMNAVNATK